MGRDCTVDSRGCITCPALPAQPEIPQHTIVNPVVGWNCGANSVAMLDGDLRTIFQIAAETAGCVIGFRNADVSLGIMNYIPTVIEHGLFFQHSAGIDFVSVTESGIQPVAAIARNGYDVFEIRRTSGVVTYWRSGSLLYTSLQSSLGVQLVTACLFASGDEVV